MSVGIGTNQPYIDTLHFPCFLASFDLGPNDLDWIYEIEVHISFQLNVTFDAFSVKRELRSCSQNRLEVST